MGWAGLDCAPAAAGGLFLAVAQNGAGWAGLAGLAGLQRWQLGAAQFFQGPAAAA